MWSELESCEIVVRGARAEDEAARAELLRLALHSQFWEAFFYFFFQELTLQCCVLGGAVLFIFCGASAGACLVGVPGAAAALVALAVGATHRAAAERLRRGLRDERRGWVAEAGAGRLVGTVSLAERRGEPATGWVQALAVHPEWRRRGAARALLAAVRAGGAAAGLASLAAATTPLQPAGRAALHAAGWQLRGSYCRPVVGAALTLLVTQLALDLPYA